MKKISKYIEYLLTKVVQTINEKTFISNGVELKYLYERHQASTNLIVVFSACTRAGIKARYNYVRTLKGVKANKLFILDNFGADSRGAYYLGENLGNEIELACRELISSICTKYALKKLYFCGSSKGGWAALNMMCAFPNAISIIGAPQYKLANYLMAPALKTCREYVMPIVSDDNIKYLNSYLHNKLSSASQDEHTVYLHFSDNEHTYNEHVKYLLSDLNEYKIHTVCECMHYENHWDVSKYFPDFLIDCLRKLNVEVRGDLTK